MIIQIFFTVPIEKNAVPIKKIYKYRSSNVHGGLPYGQSYPPKEHQ